MIFMSSHDAFLQFHFHVCQGGYLMQHESFKEKQFVSEESVAQR